MLENWLDVSYAGDNEEVVIISVQGYIDATTSPELKQLLNKHVVSEKYKIIVNLEKIEYISSTGWGVFIGELKAIRKNYGDLVLANMCTNVFNIFELMEFSSILKAFTSLEDAKVYFLGERKQVQAPVKTTGHGTAGPKTTLAKKPPSVTIDKKNITIESVTEDSTGTIADKNRTTVQNEFKKNISRLIYERPYLSINEIVQTLKLPEYGGLTRKKRELKKLLRAMGLIKHSSRFNLALREKLE